MADLLFVELWLEVTLNTHLVHNNLGGIDEHARSLLPELATDSDGLVEFAVLLRSMDPQAEAHPALKKLAGEISQKAPQAALFLGADRALFYEPNAALEPTARN